MAMVMRQTAFPEYRRIHIIGPLLVVQTVRGIKMFAPEYGYFMLHNYLLFAKIFNIDTWRFIQFNAMQLYFGRQMRTQLVPDAHGQVFSGTKLALQERNINI